MGSNLNWPFTEPENVAVFTVRQIMERRCPILRVYHDKDDGAWQFLEWGTPVDTDFMLVALKTVVAIDASLAELADLPLGWMAWRRDTGDPWQRRTTTSDPE